MRPHRGFTLIELTFVLGVIAILAAVSVPGYLAVVLRARADEAQAMLHTIAHAELRFHRDTGGFLACAPEGEVPRAPAAFPGQSACWKKLGVAPEGLLRFRYQVTVENGAFTAIAEGDLDADGKTSRYQLDGRSLALTVVDGLE